MLALRTLEFDRIVEVVAGFALTPVGAEHLSALTPDTDPKLVAAAINATSETTAYLESNPLFPLRAGAGLDEALAVVQIEGQLLEPLPLRNIADFFDSVDQARSSIRAATGSFPILSAIAARAASFTGEVAAVRHAIDPSGEVLDQASSALRSIRDQLRTKRSRLRGTLEQFIRGKDTAKYLQDQVVTERNGRYVLMIRAEHRSNVPGIVHGSSTSGATLFLEPSATVEVNNDIVELEERERDEIRRILLSLTDAFRQRPSDLQASLGVAIELDVLQAKARFGSLVGGVAPEIAMDGRLELRNARHPLLIREVRRRLGDDEGGGPADVVPTDIVLEPPSRVLLITGPNTGGKTVAIKTTGLLALMSQAGLHVPAAVAKLPVFSAVFADIGDEQSISASLSTFSGHITNIVSMDRALRLPALVILDEVGTGTDPNEGGALATAVVNHFKQRGAHVIATTHYDALKTWGTTTDGVTTAAFAFDARTFAPTYKLIYGAPGRSLAIEIAQRLGLPLPVVAAARGYLSDDQKKVAAHLARIDAQARALDSERTRLQKDRRAVDDATAALAAREREIKEREDRLAKRLNEKLDERVRQARRDIDQVIEQLKDKSEALLEQAVLRGRAAGVSTGDTGAARAEAREAIERIVEQLKDPAQPAAGAPALAPVVGARVAIGGLGLEGTIVAIQGNQAEIDVRGKRLRAPLEGLQAVSGGASAGVKSGPSQSERSRVRVNVDLQPREGLLNEVNVIGSTVDQAIDRLAKFLDDTLVTDQQQVRIVHGHGTGQLRRGIAAYLKEHPLVAKFYAAPREQGGEGATIVELKD
ncbi:MAG TPA: endonuclease MutS2 [Vicinamibacterales bacterium]|nr:endonuclease MutS2 [Vicinamibacterales bacterium]